ncbi:hypothetical protein LPC08_21450 [Roseomonas sp. OT10]|uniref:hypothetical protein n=1 Tax=Roseomonas cutis TaxID=2897332 RepID=UPI001E49C453|nr:hypothetical protein [Roseomonas sp. OT10]UFN48548.1 hypothetical protein LPC08_21450 [Roseomonas sp. OT10]
MKPMEPMKPMRPMHGNEAWWPKELGEPSSSGGQNGMRYAFFPEKRRLAVEQEGRVTLYDSGEHAISGVSQASGGAPRFTDAKGTVRLEDLRALG